MQFSVYVSFPIHSKFKNYKRECPPFISRTLPEGCLKDSFQIIELFMSMRNNVNCYISSQLTETVSYCYRNVSLNIFLNV